MSPNDLGDEMRTLMGSFFAVVIREELFVHRRDTSVSLKADFLVVKKVQFGTTCGQFRFRKFDYQWNSKVNSYLIPILRNQNDSI